jgi:NAD(P)-dependent dehydrogenase (short-subunit alcohol dehydrogenase family)
VQEPNGSRPHVAASFPPEVGKLAVVTYSTSGIGFDIALSLACAGADVIVTGKSSSDGHEALAKIRPVAPHALVRFEKLDLGSLSSEADLASRLNNAGRPIDLLINNANSLVLLKRELTQDGFELHLALNFLSHFALTARVLPLLRASKQAKVVQLTSTGRHHGEIYLHDLHLENNYTPLKAYSQSKLALMLFALELQRQSDARRWGITGSSAQPLGIHAAMLANATAVTPSMSWYRRALGIVPGRASGSSGAMERLPTETDVEKQAPATKTLADLIGPPVPEAIDMRVLDPIMARKLWDAASELTHVEWPEN